VASNSPSFLVGPQSAFPDEDDPRLQYSYPAPPQVQQPYQSFRDPSPSYSNHPILPPINVSGSHLRDERWQPNPYGGTSAATRIPEPDFSPVASYPAPSFQYPPQHHSQGMLPDNRFLPVNPPTSPSTGSRRGPTLVERTRSSAHTTSPYSRQAPAQVAPVQVATQEHPPPKKKRKRADAEQLRVLNEVYARTAFPSTEERQDLAGKLNMTPRSVQIWYASYFLHHHQSAYTSFKVSKQTTVYAEHPPPVDFSSRYRIEQPARRSPQWIISVWAQQRIDYTNATTSSGQRQCELPTNDLYHSISHRRCLLLVITPIADPARSLWTV
jgi:hypothetical protein